MDTILADAQTDSKSSLKQIIHNIKHINKLFDLNTSISHTHTQIYGIFYIPSLQSEPLEGLNICFFLLLFFNETWFR